MDAPIRSRRRRRLSQSGLESSTSELSDLKELDSSDSSSNDSDSGEGEDEEEEEEEDDDDEDEEEMEYQAPDYPQEDSGDDTNAYAPWSP